MPIRRYLPDCAAFEPEAIAAMGKAFADVCNELGVYAGDTMGREIIAMRIIGLASTGVIDADALRNCVLQEYRAFATLLAPSPQRSRSTPRRDPARGLLS